MAGQPSQQFLNHPSVTLKSPAMTGTKQRHTKYSRSPLSDYHLYPTPTPADAYKEVAIYPRLGQIHLHTQTPYVCTDVLPLPVSIGVELLFPGLTLHPRVCSELPVNFPVCFKRLCIFLSHSYLKHGKAEAWVGRVKGFSELQLVESGLCCPK